MSLLILLVLLLFYADAADDDQRRAAVIIESRKLPTLPFVINNARQILDEKWDVIVIHGDNNGKDLQIRYSEDPGITLINHLGAKALDRSRYNKLLKSRFFYQEVLAPDMVEESSRNRSQYYSHVLFFQHDTVLCGKDDAPPIDSFLDHAYVGAPWHDKISPEGGFACACLNDRSIPRRRIKVGNGGLSLRRVDSTLRSLDRFFHLSGHKPYNEDVWFACAADHFASLASVDTARKFAVESWPLDTVVGTHPQTPFGVHKPWAYLSEHDLLTLEGVCPPLTTLMNLGTFTAPSQNRPSMIEMEL